MDGTDAVVWTVMHTSASLTINENASPDVRLDLHVSGGDPCHYLRQAGQAYKMIIMQDALDRIAPQGKMYRHDDEGPDDMPAHVKVLCPPGYCKPST
jgi:thiamine phosphate synthase YjbQ (UPF0047 family)